MFGCHRYGQLFPIINPWSGANDDISVSDVFRGYGTRICYRECSVSTPQPRDAIEKDSPTRRDIILWCMYLYDLPITIGGKLTNIYHLLISIELDQ